MKTAVIYDKWLHQFGGAEVVAVNMAHILKQQGWEVTIVTGKYIHLHKIKDQFGIDLGKLPYYEVLNDETRLKQIVKGKDLFINLSFMDYSYGYAKKNIYYTHFPTPIRGFLFNSILNFFHITALHVLLPKPLRERIFNRVRAGIFFDMDKRLDSYDHILANSLFTKKWIKKYWHKEAKVLYPPVSFPTAKTGAVKEHSGETAPVNGTRQNWITSVGRFFTLGHGKKQEVMIEAFKQLASVLNKKTGKTSSVNNEWELHLVGGVNNEPSSLRFVEQLKIMAKGYPIYFHFNMPHKEVLDVLASSKIYWHATGYGEDEEKNPMAFEHFGIAPVEAIAAGCIPIFYQGGGLGEILDGLGIDKSNHMFTSVNELVKKTMSFASKKIVMKLTPQAHKENNFTNETFRKQLHELIETT